MVKNILFLTGTRADFGKMKSLIQMVDKSDGFETSLFVTGMHTLSKYGYTVDEVYKSLGEHRLSKGFRNVYTFMNQVHEESMEQVLANTISGLSRYVAEFQPDLIVVHGDRVEALAGAIVGSLRNIRVAHIEGGELSGTIDEVIRHAVTKCSHIHFVANKEAARRLVQLGEREDSIFAIGSPDIDIMLSEDLPSLEEVKKYYTIPFDEYAMAILHPVTTDLDQTVGAAEAMVSAMLDSGRNYVVIYPNNDRGRDVIFLEYKRLENNPCFVLLPSMRMEYFLTAMKESRFIIGNSSAGIRETPVYGVPAINITNRQANRFCHKNIITAEETHQGITEAIRQAISMPQHEPCYHFGRGNSAGKFLEVLQRPDIWNVPMQKQFVDVTLPEIS